MAQTWPLWSKYGIAALAAGLIPGCFTILAEDALSQAVSHAPSPWYMYGSAILSACNSMLDPIRQLQEL